MRKQYRAGAISPTDAERIDVEPKKARMPMLTVGAHVWFIDTTSRWFELEVVERAKTRGRAVTFKSVTGWDDKREVEWPYGALLEFPVNSKLYQRLRHINTRRP